MMGTASDPAEQIGSDLTLRKRLPLVAQLLPYRPDTGARIQTFNVIRQLARRFDVTLVCFRRHDTDGGRLSVQDREPDLAPWARVATFPIPFAGAVLSVLENPELPDGLAGRGRALVEAHHSWDPMGERMCQAYSASSRLLPVRALPSLLGRGWASTFPSPRRRARCRAEVSSTPRSVRAVGVRTGIPPWRA